MVTINELSGKTKLGLTFAGSSYYKTSPRSKSLPRFKRFFPLPSISGIVNWVSCHIAVDSVAAEKVTGSISVPPLQNVVLQPLTQCINSKENIRGSGL